jgi:hypothetical protein
VVPAAAVLGLPNDEFAQLARDTFARIMIRRSNDRQRTHERVRDRVTFETREGARGALVKALTRRGEAVRPASPELMALARERELDANLAWAELPTPSPAEQEAAVREAQAELAKLPDSDLSPEGRRTRRVLGQD